MYMRLGFSVAMHIQPDVLLLDEVLAVGDEAFQQKCYSKIWEFKKSGGTIVFVSHDPAAVERVCDRAILLEQGRCVESGAAGDVVRAYHRRIVQTSAESVANSDGASSGGAARVHEVRAVGGDGSVRERFTEGEPMALEVWLYAEDGLDQGRVTLGFRDSGGQTLGSQTVDRVRLRPGRLERLRLHFPGLPLREGRFFVDVGLASADGERHLDHRGARAGAQRLRPGPRRRGLDSPRRHVGVTGRRRNRRRLIWPAWSRFSYAPPAASPSSARRSGSCARPGARCPNTASSASSTACSTSRASPSSARR